MYNQTHYLMKRFIAFFIIAIVAIPIIAQPIEPPADWAAVVDNFWIWFGNLAGLAALTTFIAGFLNGVLKASGKFVRQLVAWVVAVVLAWLSVLLNIGFLAEAQWYMVVLYGVGAGFVANGFFDVGLIQAIILAIESAVGNKKE